VIVLRSYDSGSAAADPLLAGMFTDRKRLFVDLLGWDVPIDGDLEIDHFDDSMRAVDGDGRHIGSLRLLPTTRPHLLDTLFAELCSLGVVSGASTFEIIRLCLPQRLAAARRLEVRNLLISAMVDHALDSGISLDCRAGRLGPVALRTSSIR
jgi:acyl-homoserine lactone synthase